MTGTGSKKVALVTGAGSGIGRACALRLVEHGYSVVLAGRRQALLDAVVEAARPLGGEALAVACDVTDAASVAALFDTIRERHGRLDVLFNNAGRSGSPVDIDELDIDEWRSVVDTNLTGVFLCTRAAFGLMKTQSPRGGRIINNGSISAHAPRPNSIAYTATKHAITGLTKAVSLDGRKYDIVCGQIDIGNAATEMAERMARGIVQANGEIAVEPLMDVQHVADAVLHMAQLPLSANVQFMTIMASKMPFVGRG
ncbi:NAD(P)-dependent dehydrogenase (short-subunit alcohol dehydrogenase family) [Paraburkholderia terricola]|uniref:NAD(P)-dependent dehydrogenase (Short-subunit alcohol dehydrogenase family) n=1 Tax=Paraburkholderia terricola TaxID=169427 RepID=A0A1M6K2W5_9BURK|nr:MULTISPECIES: SDR family oxidoreductase [Paraburkholderia]MDR6407060.1 NAD(P)-dependent dehydrogenase (short-subunit alcohol dehydrogenase family) [Paraburkholderia terricola]MDR6479262.1 NAD(P)-dependent dehydrogenase (short-subunit alcohol dehydrogenase family) [Paraburkholderia terricola]MDR6490476.1 NAD(P)-dependent dehydrogenase (short-subunit alcohol dehydrogenase family) [Paraburkholderia terricola]SDN73656.1 NADP-dependent 3-hydroxy acid dehydrogenase YdfG [Paraburkholderia sediminic